MDIPIERTAEICDHIFLQVNYMDVHFSIRVEIERRCADSIRVNTSDLNVPRFSNLNLFVFNLYAI